VARRIEARTASGDRVGVGTALGWHSSDPLPRATLTEGPAKKSSGDQLRRSTKCPPVFIVLRRPVRRPGWWDDHSGAPVSIVY
jgi:hypothetical protein